MSNADTDYDLPQVLATYRRDGSLIREKARVLIEDWLDRIYPRMQDPDTPTSSLLAIGESLIRLGDMGPKPQSAGAGQGGGFSITINIPASDGKDAITITGTSEASGEPKAMLDITDFNPLPARPSFIPIPDFNINAELSGGLPPGMDPRAAVPVAPRLPTPADAGRGASLTQMSAFANAVMSPPTPGRS